VIACPKISCVTVTNGRVALLKKSIHCYLSQTYSNKELIVLSQGSKDANEQIGSHIDSLQRRDIQFITCDPKMSLGAMRNLSLELTTGEVVCQWDDDDLCHPFRISDQFHRLSQGAIAACYRQHLKYYLHTGEMYWIDWAIEKQVFERYLPGTIMFWKQFFHDSYNMLYPEFGKCSGREEDLCLLQRFLDTGTIADVDLGHQYIYVYHGNNIYWLEHHNLVLAKRVFTNEELLARKPLLEETFRAVGIDQPVKVRSLEGVAFEYQP
jgi:glycosyltransferase involved in cell wall biosynthesis